MPFPFEFPFYPDPEGGSDLEVETCLTGPFFDTQIDPTPVCGAVMYVKEFGEVEMGVQESVWDMNVYPVYPCSLEVNIL